MEKRLPIYVIIGIIAGALLGHLIPQCAAYISFIGELFVRLVKMMVVPLVASSVILGILQLGQVEKLGKLSVKVILFYLLTSFLAVAWGIASAEFSGAGTELADKGGIETHFSNEFEGRGVIPSGIDFFINLVPLNPVEAFTSGNLLQILTFSILLAFALLALKPDKRELILKPLESLQEALIWLVRKILILAPFAAFALVANAVANYGFDLMESIAAFFFLNAAAMVVWGFLFYPVIVQLLGGATALNFLKTALRVQTVAFSTSSSYATLPATMSTAVDDLKVSKSTASFALPLGATINMDGGAIYSGITAIFCANLFGIDLGMEAYMAIIFASTLGSIATAGVPGPTITVVAVLMSAGIPVEAIPLIFAIDRLIDMMRTALNVTGDLACAVVADSGTK